MSDAPEPGTPVRVAMTKWGDRPHWTYDAVLLGHDAHGTWVGAPAGTLHARPGLSYVSEVDTVTLVPDHDAWHLATFHAPGIWCDTYVDMTTPARWDRLPDGSSGGVPLLRAVDLDLDVIRGEHGRSWVDDEDEFADHRVSLGYPAEVVEEARRSADQVLAAVTRHEAPYDDVTAAGWLARLRDRRSAP